MHITLDKAMESLGLSSRPFAELFSQGTLSVEIYKPDNVDFQQPHERDEVYIIVSGTGKFSNGGTIIDFKAHDFLFVPAGAPHRFFDFTPDFVTWVVFYGPPGGE